MSPDTATGLLNELRATNRSEQELSAGSQAQRCPYRTVCPSRPLGPVTHCSQVLER